mgnify:CR=1 FL=1
MVSRMLRAAGRVTGVLSVGVGFTAQVVAQRCTAPADAAIVLSSETLFAALFGYAACVSPLKRELLLPRVPLVQLRRRGDAVVPTGRVPLHRTGPLGSFGSGATGQ